MTAIKPDELLNLLGSMVKVKYSDGAKHFVPARLVSASTDLKQCIVQPVGRTRSQTKTIDTSQVHYWKSGESDAARIRLNREANHATGRPRNNGTAKRGEGAKKRRKRKPPGSRHLETASVPTPALVGDNPDPRALEAPKPGDGDSRPDEVGGDETVAIELLRDVNPDVAAMAAVYADLSRLEDKLSAVRNQIEELRAEEAGLSISVQFAKEIVDLLLNNNRGVTCHE